MDAGRLKAVYEHVSKHYSEPIPLEDVARLANQGVSSFCRFFKAHTGETFARWLVKFRLRQARRLLLASPQSISTVAGKTGFGSLAYLTRCFQHEYGVAPRAWRKAVRSSQNLSDLAEGVEPEHNSPA